MKTTKVNLANKTRCFLVATALVTISVFSNACSTETKNTDDKEIQDKIEISQGKGKSESSPASEKKAEKDKNNAKEEAKTEDKSKKVIDEAKPGEKKDDKSNLEENTSKLDEAVAQLKKGAVYKTTRVYLIKAGWKPFNKSGNKSGNEKYLSEQLKFTEVDSCSGTGVGYCSLKLKALDGRTLTITTINNDSVQKENPTIESWTVK